MGWLSRNKRPAAVNPDGPGPPESPAGPQPQPAATGAEPHPPMGRYGPQVAITGFDQAAEELTWQLPVNGELYRLVPGPDRPDYSIMLLERPLHFYPQPGLRLERVSPELQVTDRKGRPMVRADALVVCARFVGQQLRPGMSELPVNIAFVVDNAVLTEPALDLDKIEYAAIGRLSEGLVAAITPSGGPEQTDGDHDQLHRDEPVEHPPSHGSGEQPT